MDNRCPWTIKFRQDPITMNFGFELKIILAEKDHIIQ
jgi:hypothetical protein